jgi:hypothetical protein
MHKSRNFVKCYKENKEIKRQENYGERRERWGNKNKKYERSTKEGGKIRKLIGRRISRNNKEKIKSERVIAKKTKNKEMRN